MFRAAYRSADAARTPHPSDFLRKKKGPDGPNRKCQGLKLSIRGVGDFLLNQLVIFLFGPDGPDGPNMQPFTCARVRPGFGGNKTFHALPVISGPSGPSGPDPPSRPFVYNGLHNWWFSHFQAQHFHIEPVKP